MKTFNSHRLEDDSEVKQRLTVITTNNKRPETARVLTDHLPTKQGNEELLGLQIVGESVFEREKACALRLITSTRLGGFG